jgi:hypothetical protein
MDFVREFVESLDSEYQDLVHDLVQVAVVYLIFTYFGSSLMSPKNPLNNAKNLEEVLQVVVLSLVGYHLIIKKFLL